MSIGYSPIFPLHFSSRGGYALNESIVDVVKQNFKNLLLTIPGERIFDSNFGVGIKLFLFEQSIEETYDKIRDRIYAQTEEYMPFLQLNNVMIVADQEELNAVHILIDYTITNLSINDTINLFVSN